MIEECGRTAVALPGDISDAAASRELVQKAVDGLGGLDILVCNAGKQIVCDRLGDLSDEQFDETFKTNVYPLFWIAKAALAHLRPGSSIIATTSVNAYMPSKDLIDYAMTEAAINNFVKGMAYVFLASSESRYVAGETLNVNGGMPTP